MKITRISIFQVDVPIKPATISHDRVMSHFDVTLVRIETDSVIEGWGDSVPWGSNFVAAFARGVRAGLDELAPKLIGQDPRMIGAINELMDFQMKGQPFVKTALDVACWDILGRSLNSPLYMLLGGMITPEPEVVGSVPPEPGEELEAMMEKLRADRITNFSGKSSGDVAKDIEYLRWMGERMRPGESLKYDGNGGWRVDEAVRVAKAMGDVDVYFEQPCATYEECREVRRTTGVPLILDESALDVEVVIRAKQDGVLDGLNLKLARVGGISKMRLIRDLCVTLNVPLEIQDSSYSELASAVVAHMGHSTPGRCIRSVIYPKGLKKATVINPPTIVNGRMFAPDAPGLGSVPMLDVIGDPIAVYN
ncbi:MAG: mandelate racemase/muconate lactonizing enzyme family protein [Gemmatimonadota bacterium]|nr:mandelate racemase/muconate lactonizing enzyme family protein [Gammaproteobacteria bacterium]MDE2726084.1 mandelate racemase/muconate lactonizing enzyme family protein [Gemmatimonadota bacterium]MYH91267.1 mandelate racemase [Gammaproteobacteria bacterium]